MTTNKLIRIMDSCSNIWGKDYKIPWHDTMFSERMLREHLTQNHDLASRRSETIQAQCLWLHQKALNSNPGVVLDMGCGPGLYSKPLTDLGHAYHGLDIGPASIEHAEKQYARPGCCEFQLGDVITADIGSGYDLVTMLFGEINVFSPSHCSTILQKMFDALMPGGNIVLEMQSREAVRKTADTNGWYKTERGLFSDAAHICLTESEWLATEQATRQLFHVIELEDANLQTYSSITKAWSTEEMFALLQTTGFTNMTIHTDWPEPTGNMMLISATKA